MTFLLELQRVKDISEHLKSSLTASPLLSGNIGFHWARCRRRQAINQIPHKENMQKQATPLWRLVALFSNVGALSAPSNENLSFKAQLQVSRLVGGRSPGRCGSSGFRFIAADGQIEGAEWSQLHQILSHRAEAEIPFSSSLQLSLGGKKEGAKAKWLKLIGRSG